VDEMIAMANWIDENMLDKTQGEWRLAVVLQPRVPVFWPMLIDRHRPDLAS
jgi:hypothetical protein